MNESVNNNVTIVDIKMPFLSMVIFMVKAVIAAIPAFIILAILFAIFCVGHFIDEGFNFISLSVFLTTCGVFCCAHELNLIKENTRRTPGRENTKCQEMKQ